MQQAISSLMGALTREEGVRLAREGGIHGVGIAANKGTEYLKSLLDGIEENNLGNLPSISNTKNSDSTPKN